jgi:hypothetical protein
MLKLLRSILTGQTAADDASDGGGKDQGGPESVQVDGAPPFPLASHIAHVKDLPYLDWDAVRAWIDALPSHELRAQAWLACERAWLLHLRAALGTRYWLAEAGEAMLLSSLDKSVARVTLDYMNRTLTRVVRLLDGIAAPSGWGKDILIVFDEHDTYYRYVSHYHPEEGEFALSSGMYVQSGCGHFVTAKSDLREVQPVIAHEMTHACVSHLPLPAWLNEGIAVNTERRLVRSGAKLYGPEEMHRRHLAFWGPSEIQQFWSGKSFLRSDDGNMLSYDLAQIIVEQLSKHWGPFQKFVLAADRADAGVAAGREHLGIDLGAYVCAILQKEDCSLFTPDPTTWDSEPEKGGFSAYAPRGIATTGFDYAPNFPTDVRLV